MVPERRLAPRRAVIPFEHPRLQGYNPLDLLAGGYFAITAVILALGSGRIPGREGYLLAHLAIVTGIALLRFVPRRGNVILMFLRDTYPLMALPLIYSELSILCQIVWPRMFDSVVLGWEASLFGLFPSVFLRDWFPNRFLQEFLHFSYLAYYLLVPVLGLRLYLWGRAEVCRVFATSVMLTFFTCYLIFIFFPVAGPYYVFPKHGVPTGLFPPIVHYLLETNASRGTAFPSSHVAGAVTVLWMTFRFERRLTVVMAPLCLGIFVGTVYGGFHYAVDSLAGAAIGVLASLAGPRVHSFLLRRARLWPLRFRFPHLVRPLVAKLWQIPRRAERGANGRRTAS